MLKANTIRVPALWGQEQRVEKNDDNNIQIRFDSHLNKITNEREKKKLNANREKEMETEWVNEWV